MLLSQYTSEYIKIGIVFQSCCPLFLCSVHLAFVSVVFLKISFPTCCLSIVSDDDHNFFDDDDVMFG